MKPLRLGVDTNVLSDLADGLDAAVYAFEVLAQRLATSEVFVLPGALSVKGHSP